MVRAAVNKIWVWGLLLSACLAIAALLQWGRSAERALFALGEAFAPRHLPNADVVIVAIDEPALARFGPWPWPRSLLAALTDRLAADKARVIAFALPLTGRQNGEALNYLEQLAALPDVRNSREARALVAQAQAALATDAAFAASIRNAGNVILAAPALPAAAGATLPDWFVAKAALESEQEPGLLAWLFGPLPAHFQPPPAIFGQAASGIGFLPAGEGTGLEPLVLQSGGHWLPSFALLVAARDLGLQNGEIVPAVTGGVSFGNEYLFTDARLRVRLRPYAIARGRPAAAEYSFAAIYDGRVPAESLTGKAVIVGLAANGGGPSLQVLGNEVSSILDGDLIATPFWAWGLRALLALLVGVYLVFAVPRLPRLLGLVASALLLILLVNLEFIPLIARDLWLPLALPVLMLVLGHGLLLGLWYLRERLGVPQEELSEANRELALACQALGRYDEALRRFLRCLPSKTLYENLLALGHEHERHRRYADAIEVYLEMKKKLAEFGSVDERLQRLQALESTSTLTARGRRPLPIIEQGLQKPVIGRYELIRELGRGAMGTVYLGRDQKIGRTVAIKTMALADEFEGAVLQEVSQRFIREAQTAGLLNHPNIITIYDVGEDQGLAYIAMDYLPGESLQNYTQPGKLLPMDETMAITIKIAEALAYAHGRQVVHRDIKPANIIYERQTGRLKITDFGVAVLTNASRTKTGTILGSPSYMSPEQVAGRKVDGRSDLFSLGVTLFQLLRGELPFEAPSLTGLMYKISNEPPPDVTFLRPDIPDCLKQLVERAMQKNPAARFQSGTEMADALRACLAKMRRPRRTAV